MSLGSNVPEHGAAPSGAGMFVPPFIAFGPFRLYPAERRLAKGEGTIPLGGRALDILILLVAGAGKVVTKQDLMREVWKGTVIDESSLRSHIASLRKALEDGVDGRRYITNVAGQGYCFVHPLDRPGLPQAPSAGPPAGHTGSPLPQRTTSIVDREGDRNTVADLLRQHRFVTIHGSGGIGKTTVALAVAHEVADTFRERTCFIDLGLLPIEASVPDALASELGLAVRNRDPTSHIVNHLRERNMLLVLDCCEHLIDSVAPLAEAIARAAPEVSILATSREPLRAEGEHVYTLAPMDTPPDGIVLGAEDVHRYAAASLFIERAFANGLRRPLSDLDAQIIARICRKVDGIALALELAAGRVSVHGLKETASLLDGRLKLSWQGRRTAVARHRTLNATLDWSHDLISKEEQAVLRRLSVLVGRFTLDDAQAVACDADMAPSDVIEALARLVAKSLVSADPDGDPVVYRLLDTTRTYAHGKLVESGERDAVARRHAAYFRERLERKRSGVPDAAQIGNIRSALDWCSSRPEETELHVRLAALAAELFLDLNLLTECRRTCERALATLNVSLAGTGHEMVLHCSLGRALLLTDNSGGDTDLHFRRALEIAEALGEGVYGFRILNDLHIHYRRAAVFNRLVPVAEQAAAIAESLFDPTIRATASLMLGASHHLVGNVANAQAALSSSIRQQILPNPASSGLMDFQSKAQLILAQTYWLQGHPDRAVDALREAEGFEPTSDLSACQALIITAETFRLMRDWDGLEDRLERLIHLSGKASLEPYGWLGLGFRGEVAMRRGDINSAIAVLRDAIARLEADRFELYLPWLRCCLAEGLATFGYWDQSLDLVSGEIASVVERGGAYYLPELLRVHGELLSGAGADSEAEAQCRQSLTLAERQGALSWQLRTTTSLARLRSRQGHRAEARTMLAGVLSSFTEGFGTADLKAAALLLEELEAPAP